MSRTVKIVLGTIAALAVIVLGLAWIAGYPPFDNTPEEATIEAAAEAAAESADPSEAATTGPLDSIDGTWVVVLNDDATFVGYRINEVLTTVGDFEVVGRTSDVSGSLQASGTTITSVDLTAQMATLTTDNSGRDNAMRSQALETGEFPEATFVLTSPIDIGAIPDEGETISVVATGDLTVHGVTQSVEFPLDATLTNGAIVVVGQLDIALADFDIDPPSARIVASVEDVAVLELSLIFGKP